ncbi:MAG: Amidohydro-rel domain-containing protein [Deltaproteobacteria bacterium]|nr:Amidohydro-rel domain-containing protein [Deltaproteobacteria bacterium]
MAIKAVHGAANLSLSELTASSTRILARIEPDKCLGSIVGNTPSNRISKTVRFWVVGCSGIDHIMVGTDYPYDLGDWDAAKKVEQLDIPEADQLLMLEGNAKRLLKL